ncbi:MAG TPA: GDSL-type esterase/lipase family protein [Stellaceae bacterium]|jgi:lysophospholipase L1-like esterase|nr:GDSL-type esterase/lipase family protein [Stellaceae bacterium]
MDTEKRRRGLGRAAWALPLVFAVGVFVLLVACFHSFEAPPPPPAEPQRLASPEALAPFFAVLDNRASPQPLRIMQIGDSHTANDSLSGRMRQHFQGRFGAAGRGWLPAGVPFKYYRPQFVSVGESERGWKHVRPNDHAGIALGLDAVAAESEPRDAVMSLQSTESEGFDRFAVEYLTQPNGSAFTVAVDGGAPARVSTASAVTAVTRFDLPLDRPAHQIELRAEGKPPVALLGWDIERQTPGVVYENHGTIGATVGLLEQMTPEAVSFEFDQRRPALIIVAFGTNEGFDDGLDLDRYAARFRDDVAALRQKAHGVPVLVLGPPNGNRHDHACTAASCGSSDPCAWNEPEKLAAVRDIERRAAAQNGWVYWDWFGAMGGTCSIDRMGQASPPLAMPDHVHLSTPGYQAMADLLFGDLMRAYETWKAQPRTS